MIAVIAVTVETAGIVEASDSYPVQLMAVFEDFWPLQVSGHSPVSENQHFSYIQILLSPNNLNEIRHFFGFMDVGDGCWEKITL